MTINQPTQEFPKAYDHRPVEERLYRFWMEQGYFTPAIQPDKKPFVIIMPPPNVTGELHLGHAVICYPGATPVGGGAAASNGFQISAVALYPQLRCTRGELRPKVESSDESR